MPILWAYPQTLANAGKVIKGLSIGFMQSGSVSCIKPKDKLLVLFRVYPSVCGYAHRDARAYDFPQGRAVRDQRSPKTTFPKDGAGSKTTFPKGGAGSMGGGGGERGGSKEAPLHTKTPSTSENDARQGSVIGRTRLPSKSCALWSWTSFLYY